MNIRQDIQGTTPQDLNKMNENFMAMWQKVYGNIDFADVNNVMKGRIMTQWLPFQGEGNLDSSYPLEIRFFVPPNIDKLKKATINVRSEHYRMDSNVAKDDGGFASGDVALDLAGSEAIISTELEDTSQTSFVNAWGNWESDGSRPGNGVQVETGATYRLAYDRLISDGYGDGAIERTTIPMGASNVPYWVFAGHPEIKFATVYQGQTAPSSTYYLLDLAQIQHKHDMKHGHVFRLNQSKHTHSGSVSVDIPPHGHTLNEGIKVSTTSPQNVEVFVNSMKVGSTLNGINSFNNVDISPFIITGEWNVVKVSCSNLARVVLYGIIEMIIKN